MAISYIEALQEEIKAMGATEVTKVKKRNLNLCLECKIPICSVCNVCHSDGCIYAELHVTSPEDAARYRHLRARTQKAKGFVNLANSIELATPSPYYLIMEESDIVPAVTDALHRGQYELFVRPCPVRARHGFEESRPVIYNKDAFDHASEVARMTKEVKQIFAAANAADEEHAAELLLLPYIKAEFNSIITPSRMAVGPNHDGATAGYDSIQIPLMGVPFAEAYNNFIEKSGVAAHEDPYIEVVSLKHLMNPLFTQVRAGVRLPAAVGADYVPAPLRVAEVIDAAGDLLEWEKQVKEMKPGTVVVKLGGTLISHYGVHCLYNKVPCFTSRRPAIGELLDVVSTSPSPDPQAVIRGLAYGALMPVYQGDSTIHSDGRLPMNAALVAMMVTLHNAGAMSGDDGFWLGVAASTMMRAGMAGSHGEARHKLPNLGRSRSYVYKLALQDFHSSRRTLGTAQWMFQNLQWSSSYGGKAWAKCTQSILDMDVAVQKLLNEPTVENVGDVVSKLNVAVNQAHNGGWWLNKFIEQHWFDRACNQSLIALAVAAHTMYAIKKVELSQEAVDTFILDWQTAPAIEVKSGGKLQMQEADASISQETFGPNDVPKHPDCEKVYPAINPHLMGYEGAVCMSCFEKYGFMTAVDLETPLPCGHIKDGISCKGYVGYSYKDGSSWVVMPTTPTSDDDDGEPLWDPPEDEPEVDTSTQAPKGIVVPEDGFYNPGVESVPAIKAKFHSDKLHNVTGKIPCPAGTTVTVAQVNFSTVINNGLRFIVHLQYKANHLDAYKYYSTNVESPVKFSPNISAKILKGSEVPMVSWSGSGVYNYWALGRAGLPDGTVALVNYELGIELILDPVHNTLKMGAMNDNEEKLEVTAETAAPSEQAVAEAIADEDIPF